MYCLKELEKNLTLKEKEKVINKLSNKFKKRKCEIKIMYNKATELGYTIAEFEGEMKNFYNK